MKVLTWNLEWARPGSPRERSISRIIADADPDLICLTEAYRSTLPPGGYVIESGTGNAVADRKRAKKVLIWSKGEWARTLIPGEVLPLGRMVIGATETPIGQLRVVGVCIPWAGSSTPRYGGSRKPWDDHLEFIAGLRKHLGGNRPTIIIGDFNQRIPRTRQPIRVAQALECALRNFVIPTEGFRERNGDFTIDHVCHSRDFKVEQITEIPKRAGDVRLSDHFGLAVELAHAHR